MLTASLTDSSLKKKKVKLKFKKAMELHVLYNVHAIQPNRLLNMLG